MLHGSNTALTWWDWTASTLCVWGKCQTSMNSFRQRCSSFGRPNNWTYMIIRLLKWCNLEIQVIFFHHYIYCHVGGISFGNFDQVSLEWDIAQTVLRRRIHEILEAKLFKLEIIRTCGRCNDEEMWLFQLKLKHHTASMTVFDLFDHQTLMVWLWCLFQTWWLADSIMKS